MTEVQLVKLLIAIFSILVIIIPLVICNWEELSLLFKHSKTENKNNSVKKELIEFKNYNGDIYYDIKYDKALTGIRWKDIENAKFVYEHMVEYPRTKYIYPSTHCHPYYVMYFDKCVMYVVPTLDVRNKDDKYYYKDLGRSAANSEYFKYVFFMCDEYNFSHTKGHKTLEDKYNNAISADYYEEKTLMSTDKEAQINKKLKNAISNNDIKELQNLINEYKATVNLSNKLTNILLKTL